MSRMPASTGRPIYGSGTSAPGAATGDCSLLITSHFITDEERFDRVYDLHDGKTVLR